MVFERNEEVGGLLRYGIPTMKLGKDVRIALPSVESTYLCLQHTDAVVTAHKKHPFKET